MEDELVDLDEVIVQQEGDVIGLFHQLWRKNSQGLPCPEVNVPHTVIFRDGKPKAWYFTSMKEQQLMRKHKSNMTGSNVVQAMATGEDPAVLLSAVFTGRIVTHSAANPKPSKGSTKRRQPLVLESPSTLLMDTVQLQLCLAPAFDQYHDSVASNELFDGVLQKWVSPRGFCNWSIKATWTPQVLVLERRTNKVNLNYRRVAIAERVATFGQPPWLSEHSEVGGTALVGRVRASCKAIVAHLKDVSGGCMNVRRMELHFKVDPDSRLWLTHCASMIVDDPVTHKAVPRDPTSGVTLRSDFQPPFKQSTGGGVRPPSTSPEFRDQIAAMSIGNISKTKRSIALPEAAEPKAVVQQPSEPVTCVMTGKLMDPSECCEVTYMLLLQHWVCTSASIPDAAQRQAAMTAIPPWIKTANPHITQDHFTRNCNQPEFLYKIAYVCSAAAQQLTVTSLLTLSESVRGPTTASSAGTSLSPNNVESLEPLRPTSCPVAAWAPPHSWVPPYFRTPSPDTLANGTANKKPIRPSSARVPPHPTVISGPCQRISPNSSSQHRPPITRPLSAPPAPHPNGATQRLPRYNTPDPLDPASMKRLPRYSAYTPPNRLTDIIEVGTPRAQASVSCEPSPPEDPAQHEVLASVFSTVPSSLSRTVSSVPILESGESSNIMESLLLAEVPEPVLPTEAASPPAVRAAIPFALMPKGTGPHSARTRSSPLPATCTTRSSVSAPPSSLFCTLPIPGQADSNPTLPPGAHNSPFKLVSSLKKESSVRPLVWGVRTDRAFHFEPNHPLDTTTSTKAKKAREKFQAQEQAEVRRVIRSTNGKTCFTSQVIRKYQLKGPLTSATLTPSAKPYFVSLAMAREKAVTIFSVYGPETGFAAQFYAGNGDRAEQTSPRDYDTPEPAPPPAMLPQTIMHKMLGSHVDFLPTDNRNESDAANTYMLYPDPYNYDDRSPHATDTNQQHQQIQQKQQQQAVIKNGHRPHPPYPYNLPRQPPLSVRSPRRGVTKDADSPGRSVMREAGRDLVDERSIKQLKADTVDAALLAQQLLETALLLQPVASQQNASPHTQPLCVESSSAVQKRVMCREALPGVTAQAIVGAGSSNTIPNSPRVDPDLTPGKSVGLKKAAEQGKTIPNRQVPESFPGGAQESSSDPHSSHRTQSHQHTGKVSFQQPNAALTLNVTKGGKTQQAGAGSIKIPTVSFKSTEVADTRGGAVLSPELDLSAAGASLMSRTTTDGLSNPTSLDQILEHQQSVGQLTSAEQAYLQDAILDSV